MRAAFGSGCLSVIFLVMQGVKRGRDEEMHGEVTAKMEARFFSFFFLFLF